MNNDPYTVLGVSRDATDAEVKAAYSNLAKKYHPDRNPGNTAAEQKMKEVNAAYDAIKNHKDDYDSSASSYSSRTNSNGNFYGGPYGGFGFGGFNYGGSYRNSSYSQDDEGTAEMNAAKHYINTGYYKEALNVLLREKNHTARWHYFCALASMGLGNNADALSHAKSACEMEPDNSRYQSFLSQLQYGGNVYERYSAPAARFSPWAICWGIILIRFILNLCFWR